MDLTNESYLILIHGKTWSERYYKDDVGWLKVSARGRKFRMTAEQVLNHVLPAMAAVKPGITIQVEHREAQEARPAKAPASPRRVRSKARSTSRSTSRA